MGAFSFPHGAKVALAEEKGVLILHESEVGCCGLGWTVRGTPKPRVPRSKDRLSCQIDGPPFGKRATFQGFLLGCSIRKVNMWLAT